jgi:Cu+-exporting ATPase
MMTIQTFQVADMNCSACAMHIEAIEDELEGIESVDVSYKKLRMVVEYDEAKVTVQEIVQAVKNTGYTAVSQP